MGIPESRILILIVIRTCPDRSSSNWIGVSELVRVFVLGRPAPNFRRYKASDAISSTASAAPMILFQMRLGVTSKIQCSSQDTPQEGLAKRAILNSCEVPGWLRKVQ